MSHAQDFLRQAAIDAGYNPTGYGIHQVFGLNYGWSRTTCFNYARGSTLPNDEHAGDIADALGLDPVYVLAAIAADRARDDRVKAWWEQAAERLRQTAAAVIMSALAGLVAVGGMAAPSKAYASVSPVSVTSPVIHYAQRFAGAVRRLFREAADALEAFFEGLLFAS